MLESWDFSLKFCINKDNQISFFFKKLHSKGLERSIRNVGPKSRALFDFLIGFWHFQLEYLILEFKIIIHSFLVYT
jgi:hypothetical protein